MNFGDDTSSSSSSSSRSTTRSLCASAADPKRAHLISRENCSAIPEEHAVIDDVRNVYMLVLQPSHTMEAGASTVGKSFSREDPSHAYAEAVLQLAITAVGKMSARMRDPATEHNFTHRGEPVRVYLEAVLNSDRADAEEHAQRPFMRGVPDDVLVVAYRVWIFVFEALDENLSFGGMFMETVRQSNGRYIAHTAPRLVARRGRRGGGAGGAAAAAGGDDDGGRGGGGGVGGAEKTGSDAMSSYAGNDGSSGGPSFASTLGANEKYALLHDYGVLARCIDRMTRVCNLQRRRVMDAIQSPDAAAGTPANPVHPNNSLTPYVFFAVPPVHGTCESQAALCNYLVRRDGASSAWSFARRDTVVRIDSSALLVPRLARMYWPPYQARNLDTGRAFDAVRRYRMSRMQIAGLAAAAVAAPPAPRGRRRRRGARAVAWVARMMFAADDEYIDSSDYDGREDDDDEEEEEEEEEPRRRNIGDIFPGLAPLGIGALAPPKRVPAEQRLEAADGSGVFLDELAEDDGVEMQQGDYEDADSMASRRLLNACDGPDRSAFHDEVFRGKKMERDLADLASGQALMGGAGADAPHHRATQAELREMYERSQRTQFMAYAERLAGRSSRISGPGKILAAWYEERVASGEDPWLGSAQPLVDPGMSTLGNWVARFHLGIETCASASTCHAQLFKCWLGSGDAYRHEPGTMHFAVLMWGKAMTSKTFVTEALERMLVRETCEEQGRATKASQFCDMDRNDRVVTMDELPPALAAKNATKGGDPEATTQWKQFLTKGEYVGEVFNVGPDGVRKVRRTYSQAQSTHFTCSNLKLHEIDAPIVSRHDVSLCLPHVRPGHTPADMVGAVLALDARARGRVELWLGRCHAAQFLVFHTLKLIAVRALTPVTTPVFFACSQTLNRVLTSRFCIVPHVRNLERMHLLVRLLVVHQALQYVTSSPASPHFRAPFSVHQLKDVDPLLHDTEEIVYFVFDMMRDQIVPAVRHIVLASLWRRLEEVRRTGRDACARAHARTRLAVDEGQRRRLLVAAESTSRDLQCHYLTPNTRIYPADIDNTAREKPDAAAAAAGGGVHVLARNAPNLHKVQMWAYFVLPADVYTLGTSIAHESAAGETPVDASDARSALRDLRDQTIHGNRYVWDEQRGEPRRATARDAQRHGFELRTQTVPAIIINGKSEIFVHLDVVHVRTQRHPVDAAIEACRTRFGQTVPRYVTAVPVSMQHPHLMRVRTDPPPTAAGAKRKTLVRDASRTVTYEMQMQEPELYGVAGHDERNDGLHELRHSYDEMSARARARARSFCPSTRAWRRAARARLTGTRARRARARTRRTRRACTATSSACARIPTSRTSRTAARCAIPTACSTPRATTASSARCTKETTQFSMPGTTTTTTTTTTRRKSECPPPPRTKSTTTMPCCEVAPPPPPPPQTPDLLLPREPLAPPPAPKKPAASPRSRLRMRRADARACRVREMQQMRQ